MDMILERIKEIALSNNGFIRTSQIEDAGLSRTNIKKYVECGNLRFIRKGIYALTDENPDEYLLLQVQCKNCIFSYGTALYMWGLSDRTPHIVDISVPQGTNISTLKKNNTDIRCHYVNRKNYDVGITETKSPQGGIVRLYDKERCICDLIRNKDKIDIQILTDGIRKYFKNPNLRKLIRYSRIFGIENEVRTYMEVLV